MNRILLRAMLVATLIWLALQFYSPGDSDAFDHLLYVLIILTNAGVMVHMFWDRKLSIWGSGSVAILFGAAGWATLFGWFLCRVLFRFAPGVSEAWLDVVRALIVVSGPMLIYAMVRFRLDKKGDHAHPGELLTEGLHERRHFIRRKEDRDRIARLEGGMTDASS